MARTNDSLVVIVTGRPLSLVEVWPVAHNLCDAEGKVVVEVGIDAEEQHAHGVEVGIETGFERLSPDQRAVFGVDLVDLNGVEGVLGEPFEKLPHPGSVVEPLILERLEHGGSHRAVRLGEETSAVCGASGGEEAVHAVDDFRHSIDDGRSSRRRLQRSGRIGLVRRPARESGHD